MKTVEDEAGTILPVISLPDAGDVYTAAGDGTSTITVTPPPEYKYALVRMITGTAHIWKVGADPVTPFTSTGEDNSHIYKSLDASDAALTFLEFALQGDFKLLLGTGAELEIHYT